MKFKVGGSRNNCANSVFEPHSHFLLQTSLKVMPAFQKIPEYTDVKHYTSTNFNIILVSDKFVSMIVTTACGKKCVYWLQNFGRIIAVVEF